MSNLHITRKRDWRDEEGPCITPEEWLDLLHNDPELRIQDESQPYHALWDGPGRACSIDYNPDEGGLFSIYPTDEFFNKMLRIAALLGAKVQGDTGVIYYLDGSTELWVEILPSSYEE